MKRRRGGVDDPSHSLFHLEEPILQLDCGKEAQVPMRRGREGGRRISRVSLTVSGLHFHVKGRKEKKLPSNCAVHGLFYFYFKPRRNGSK
jgi:hypothetical protein